MKITVTYKKCYQIGPEDWAAHTKVIYFKESETLKEVHDKLTSKYSNKDFDGEIHFDCEGVYEEH